MKQLINKARYFGVKETDSFFSQRSTILLNEIIIATGPFSFLLYPEYIIKGQMSGIINILILQIAVTIIFWLNYNYRTQPAKWFYNIFFTFYMTSMIMLHGQEMRADYFYILYVITSVIFFEKLWQQVVSIALTVSCYLFSIYYTKNYPAIMAENVSDWTSSVVFMSMCLVAFLIMRRFKMDSDNHEKEIKQQNNTLAQVNQDLERFAYISSHNLKTPVRTIRSFIDLMKRDLKKGNTKNLPEFINYVEQGAEQMHFLITGILEYSQVNETSNIQLEEVNLNQSIEYIYTQIQGVTEKPILLEIDQLPTIQSNRVLINAVFQNIIENSVKYNDKETIELKIRYEEKENNHQVSFYDNGIGISKEYHDRIFQMFERLHSNETYQGTGIGLAMTKKIIEKLNGSIRLTSIEGENTTFFIELPK